MPVDKTHLRIAGSVFLLLSVGCKRQESSTVSRTNFVVIGADRQTGKSAFPIAIDPRRVGKYSAKTSSGAGYIYDDVLEYRVWFHPEKGAMPLNGRDDYFVAFAQYEPANSFSENMPGSEPALVLVLQREWINEPKKDKFIPMRRERITEWQVGWLKDSKRNDKSIEEFLKSSRPPIADGSGNAQE